MAPRPPAVMATNVIDLTSDGEDTTYFPPARNSTRYQPILAPAQTRPILPPSFNGLPDPIEFVGSHKTATTSGLNRALGPRASTSGNSLKKSAAHAPLHDNNLKRVLPHTPNAQSGTSYKKQKTGSSSASSRVPPANYGVKRTPVDENALPATAPNHAFVPAVATRDAASPQIASIVPAERWPSSDPRLPVVLGQNTTTLSTTAGKAVANGTPTKPSSIAARNSLEIHDSRMERVIEQQVLAHVHKAVRPFEGNLAREQRSTIGQTVRFDFKINPMTFNLVVELFCKSPKLKTGLSSTDFMQVASKLVSDPGFIDDYCDNDRSLSDEYEKRISENARALVNDEVKKILEILDGESSASFRENSSVLDISAVSPYNSNRHKQRYKKVSDESRSSSERTATETSRGNSPSSSTSLGNEDAGAEAGKGLEAANEIMHPGTSIRPPRASRATNPVYAKLKRSRRSAAQMLADSLLQGDRPVRTKASAAAAVVLPASVSPSVADGTESFKVVRKRRNKAEMAAYRVIQASGGRGNVLPSFCPGNSGLGTPRFTDNPLAAGNFARSHVVQKSNSTVNVAQAKVSSTEDYLLRPYVSTSTRRNLQQQLARPEFTRRFSKVELSLIRSPRFHVDFSDHELRLLCKFVVETVGLKGSSLDGNESNIMAIMKENKLKIPRIVAALENSKNQMSSEGLHELLRTRTLAAISDLLNDALSRDVGKLVDLSVVRPKRHASSDDFLSLLRERELHGVTPVRTRRGQNSCKIILQSHLEDKLIRQSEWTDCSSDISSISWTSEMAFISGALTHSDSHNMQYNKPGNLLVGSLLLDTVRSYPDHRIPRPLVAEQENAENSLYSMRTTQSPWLYTSVVSTAYCDFNGFSFTASFDGTVKVWSVSHDGSSMQLRGTWEHSGKVNFVATSPHHGRIATGFETNSNAVRIYNFDKNDIGKSSYDSYCGNKSMEQADDLRRREKWSYQPATMQWGKSPGVVHMLLVGYSPRSDTGHEHEIPEEKRNSGELCLWNSLTSDQILISSAKTQNVFEVMWHPTQPLFLAATSPCGAFDAEKTRTQVRLFAQTSAGPFTMIKTLDCPALDINELTIMPNSCVDGFVTASCTDGLTYVWDTALGDQPIHVLRHGETLDNPDPDEALEIGDSGVKFAAWGQSSDRFYTGGSDGVVKAWDIKAPPGKAFVRDVLSVSGGISAGAFSPDRSKLLIGDASGKIYFLSIDDSDIRKNLDLSTPIQQRVAIGSQLSRGVKRPKIVIPHPEPPPPHADSQASEEVEQTGTELSQVYLDTGFLVQYPNEEYPDRLRGVFQGPRYLNNELFVGRRPFVDKSSHVNHDEQQELLPSILAKQQFHKENRAAPLRVPRLPKITTSDPDLHRHNLDIDFNFEDLSPDVQNSLVEAEVELCWDNYTFNYDFLPSKIHWVKRDKRDKKNKKSKVDESASLRLYDPSSAAASFDASREERVLIQAVD
ncbi:WD repeat domain-containing protein [Diplocarpon rosae]|nr:WD repeat domain-containing protein [Diplocarpon rosae]